MNTAIVTINIGKEYQRLWRSACQENWGAYCGLHGYDLINIEEPLDTSDRANSRSPAWQKLLILSQDWAKNYDRIVWVDSDIIINLAAPNIVEGVPEEKIGCVDEFTYPTREVRKAAVLAKRAQERDVDAGLFHTCVGLPTAAHNHIVQTGVMVLSPRHHRELFEHTYQAYEDAGPNFFYEMRFLSHEILKAGLQHWIDPKFNALVIWLAIAEFIRSGWDPNNVTEMQNFLREEFSRNFFFHFCGQQKNLMQFAKSIGLPSYTI